RGVRRRARRGHVGVRPRQRRSAGDRAAALAWLEGDHPGAGGVAARGLAGAGPVNATISPPQAPGAPTPVPATDPTRPGEAWTRLRIGPALLGFCAGWVALIAWSGMVGHPRRYLVATLVIGLLVTLSGVALRALRVPAWGVITGQVVVG